MDPETFITRYTLKLDPLPCWRHLPEEEMRRRIKEIVDDVDSQTARPEQNLATSTRRGMGLL